MCCFLAICACSTFLQGMYPANMDALTAVPRTPNSRLIKSYLKTILANPESRKIFYFLMLNLCYMLVQMLYGVWTNSLGLISDGTFSLSLSSTIRSQLTNLYSYSYGFRLYGYWCRTFCVCYGDMGSKWAIYIWVFDIKNRNWIHVLLTVYFQLWTHWDIIWIC